MGMKHTKREFGERWLCNFSFLKFIKDYNGMHVIPNSPYVRIVCEGWVSTGKAVAPWSMSWYAAGTHWQVEEPVLYLEYETRREAEELGNKMLLEWRRTNDWKPAPLIEERQR